MAPESDGTRNMECTRTAASTQHYMFGLMLALCVIVLVSVLWTMGPASTLIQDDLEDAFTPGEELTILHYSPPWYNTGSYEIEDWSPDGEAMILRSKLLARLHYPWPHHLPPAPQDPTLYQEMVDEMLNNLTFVTASSSNHFQESRDAVASVQTVYPTHKIIYYDLGLLDEQREEISKMCGVEYRPSPLHGLPFYLHRLGEYRWKPILTYITALEFGAILWMDTSVRLLPPSNESTGHALSSTSLMRGVIQHILGVGGVGVFEPTGHSLHAVTHPRMLHFFPSPPHALQTHQQYSAVALYLATQRTYTNVLRWLLACAVHRQCLAPPGSQPWCRWHGDRFAEYAECHRYDQSLLNILLLNQSVNYTQGYVIPNGGEVLVVERERTKRYEVKMCGE